MFSELCYILNGANFQRQRTVDGIGLRSAILLSKSRNQKIQHTWHCFHVSPSMPQPNFIVHIASYFCRIAFVTILILLVTSTTYDLYCKSKDRKEPKILKNLFNSSFFQLQRINFSCRSQLTRTRNICSISRNLNQPKPSSTSVEWKFYLMAASFGSIQCYLGFGSRSEIPETFRLCSANPWRTLSTDITSMLTHFFWSVVYSSQGQLSSNWTSNLLPNYY